MSTSPTESAKYEFREVVSARGGRFLGKVKIGKGEGREFVTVEVAALLEDREVVQLQKAVTLGKKAYANIGLTLTELRGDLEMMRRLVAVAEQMESKLDAKAIESV